MRGDKHCGSKCPDCGERVVFMKREDGKSTPPLRPPEVNGGV